VYENDTQRAHGQAGVFVLPFNDQVYFKQQRQNQQKHEGRHDQQNGNNKTTPFPI
jgi:hypothetical protein